MRGLVVSLILIGLVIVGFGVGLFGQVPGLMLAGFCLSPFAFMAFGWSLGRSGLRVTVAARDDYAAPRRLQQRPAMKEPLSARLERRAAMNAQTENQI